MYLVCLINDHRHTKEKRIVTSVSISTTNSQYSFIQYNIQHLRTF